MESIFGLPAHPFFIHAPVVLMPLAMLLAIVFAVRPAWRRKAKFVLPAVALVVLVTTQLAIQSGLEFDEVVGDRVNTDTHESLALMTRNLIIVFLVTSLLLAIFDWWYGRGGPQWLGSGMLLMVALTVLSSVAATVWMARTGDEGARLVWDGILNSLRPLG